jgi:hypothetical protein
MLTLIPNGEDLPYFQTPMTEKVLRLSKINRHPGRSTEIHPANSVYLINHVFFIT